MRAKVTKRQITHNNHYVPQFYLRRWSKNGNTVNVYDRIIRHEAMRGWKTKSIKSTACWPDFYTDEVDGFDDDKFEHYCHGFEDAAKGAIDTIQANETLSSKEMESLVDFLILQLARTPSFVKFVQDFCKGSFGSVFESTVRDVERDTATGAISDKLKSMRKDDHGADLHSLPMRITLDRNSSSISAEMYTGRQSFLSMALHIIEGMVGELLRSAEWTVMKTREPLLTSDNPVVIMKKDYPNGWSTGLNKGLIGGFSFVYLPLTPRHLLITRIGFSRDAVDAFMLSEESMELLQWGIVSNAHRYVYAMSEDERVEQWRPQLLNREIYDDLDAERKRWHQDNIRIESQYRLTPLGRLDTDGTIVAG